MSVPPEKNIEERPVPLDVELAPVMWVASLLFLVVLGMLLHLSHGDLNSVVSVVCLKTLALIYFVYPVELVLHWYKGNRIGTQHLWVLLIPPLRMATADHQKQKRIWLPILGWQELGKSLESRLHDWFSFPMMGLALLVLPLIICELIWSERISLDPFWYGAFQSATALIWIAFVIEFVTMFSITTNKKRYLIKNWIDVVVIFLPLVAFLRSVRLAKLLKLNQMSKSVRLYRMRGLALRTWRAIVALDLLDRILIRDPEARLLKLEARLEEGEHELEMLRGKITSLKVMVEERRTIAASEQEPRGNMSSSQAPKPSTNGSEATASANVTGNESKKVTRLSRPSNQPSPFAPAKLDERYLRSGFFGRHDLTDHG